MKNKTKNKIKKDPTKLTLGDLTDEQWDALIIWMCSEVVKHKNYLKNKQ